MNKLKRMLRPIAITLGVLVIAALLGLLNAHPKAHPSRMSGSR